MRLLPVKVLNSMVIQLGEDKDCVNVTLHKTVRIPEDEKTYPLPPSLGMFTIHKVDDFAEKVPSDWLKTGGVFFCMRQSEAMWLQFNLVGQKPKAMKVAVGKVNAINGKEWSNDLKENDSDYIIVPEQKWLDGIATSRTRVKQFVAEPLGSGLTIEEQVTGGNIGGIQLLAYNSKHDILPKKKEKRRIEPFFPPPPQPYHPPYEPGPVVPNIPPVVCMSAPQSFSRSTNSGAFSGHRMRGMVSAMKQPAMVVPNVCECDDISFGGAKEIGLAAGGTMKQKVYEDEYGYETWDQNKFGRIFVHVVNSEMYEQITGEKAPKSEITAKVYTQQGYPWFDVYDEDKKGVGGSSILKNVKSVKELKEQKKNIWPKEDNETVQISNVITIGEKKIDDQVVRDGDW